MTVIDCIADLHGHYPKLDGGDLLIVAGDLTGQDSEEEHVQFFHWTVDLLTSNKYKKIVVIAGNHDKYLQGRNILWPSCDYLCDSGTEFEGLKIWGSPWTKRFPGMNPKCMAFTKGTEEELAERWALIPDDTDILVTHGPPYGLNDEISSGKKVGSYSLLSWIAQHANTVKLHVFGHIHEAYGFYDVRQLQDRFDEMYTTVFVNCSHVNERYEPVNAPVRIIL